ncbi:DUF4198 domain-containing protein [Massilia sp. HP4]|uniref:DUF4198 domain-containing protein n=1 Tax=Massilia sp. HP4 TaxID=2562316 RepID=UPI0010C0094F|nr:DUF4198 domain-containing protein [Massilia sp. HP4]
MRPVDSLRTLLLAASLVGGAAQAHTPFLLPNNFDVQPKGSIGVDAGFTEKFFVSDVAFGDTPFSIVTPQGERIAFGDIHQFKQRTVAEQKLPDEKGTYRLSTGPRLGAVFRTWERNGKTESARDPQQVMPADAKLLAHYQSLSISEAYVTADKPLTKALAPVGKGLEIVAITHPSDLFVDERFEFIVQFDGKPLVDQKVSIYRSPMDLASQSAVQHISTDALGKAVLPLAKPGIYLGLIRHRAPAPAGAAAPNYGHNYTLTFRVLDQ